MKNTALAIKEEKLGNNNPVTEEKIESKVVNLSLATSMMSGEKNPDFKKVLNELGIRSYPPFLGKVLF